MIEIIRLLQDNRIPYSQNNSHATEGWVQVHCPFCGGGSTGFHLGFTVTGNASYCWKCGNHKIYSSLSAVLRISRNSLYTLLKDYTLSVRHKIRNTRLERTLDSFNGKTEPVKPPNIGEFTDKHKKYLENRGYKPELLIDTWNLYGSGFRSASWNWRVIAPIYNQYQRLVGYTGRSIIKNEKLRWKTSSKNEIAINPKYLLYGINHITDRVLVVEGPSDCWRMGAGAVGLLGQGWKKEQAYLLRHIPNRFIMFDPSPSAQKKAKELARWLSGFPGETYILDGIKSDPGDLSQSEADTIMKDIGF